MWYNKKWKWAHDRIGRSVYWLPAFRSLPGSQYPVIPRKTSGTLKIAAPKGSHVALSQHLLSFFSVHAAKGVFTPRISAHISSSAIALFAVSEQLMYSMWLL